MAVALIGELLEWVRTDDGDAKLQEGRVDFGGGDTAICVDYQAANRDCPPVPGDFAVCVPAPESGSYVIVGWVDPWNQGVAKEGEARLYARDGVDVVAALHITKDGNEPDMQGLVMALVARADRVDAELEKLEAAHNDHTHSYNDSKGTGSIATPSVTDVPSSVAAAPGAAVPDFQYSPEPTGCDNGWIT